jgi:hypothetical protein
MEFSQLALLAAVSVPASAFVIPSNFGRHASKPAFMALEDLEAKLFAEPKKPEKKATPAKKDAPKKKEIKPTGKKEKSPSLLSEIKVEYPSTPVKVESKKLEPKKKQPTPQTKAEKPKPSPVFEVAKPKQPKAEKPKPKPEVAKPKPVPKAVPVVAAKPFKPVPAPKPTKTLSTDSNAVPGGILLGGGECRTFFRFGSLLSVI